MLPYSLLCLKLFQYGSFINSNVPSQVIGRLEALDKDDQQATFTYSLLPNSNFSLKDNGGEFSSSHNNGLAFFFPYLWIH